MSYSCGKDSTLALHKLIKAGHEPVGLLVMVNKDMDRSWFTVRITGCWKSFQRHWRFPCFSVPSEVRNIIWNLKRV